MGSSTMDITNDALYIAPGCLWEGIEYSWRYKAASSISSESSPVSSPATNHSSPVSTPKRGPLGPGPMLVPSGGHSVPNTPPVVTIAPTKTSNGLWRNEGRQLPPGHRGDSLNGKSTSVLGPPISTPLAPA
ncbi:unnamed protein product [Boreogadus saida]